MTNRRIAFEDRSAESDDPVPNPRQDDRPPIGPGVPPRDVLMRYPANCLKAAQQVADQTLSVSLLNMAQVWLSLASALLFKTVSKTQKLHKTDGFAGAKNASRNHAETMPKPKYRNHAETIMKLRRNHTETITETIG
jgi:hypothetical protein